MAEDVQDNGETEPAQLSKRHHLKARGRSSMKAGGLANDTVWALGIEVLTLITALVSFALLGKSLGTVGYGQYISVFSVSSIIGALAASGTSLAVLHHAVREGEDLEHVFRSCLSIALSAGVLLSAIALPITLIGQTLETCHSKSASQSERKENRRNRNKDIGDRNRTCHIQPNDAGRSWIRG